MFDQLNRAVVAAKRSVAFVAEHRETVKELLASNFSAATLAHLSDRQLLLPESAIWREIQALPEARGVVDSIRCHANGIDLAMHTVKVGATLDATVRLRLRELQIGEARQELVAEIADESVQGRNWWGKIVVGIGHLFIDSFVRQAVEKSAMVDRVDFVDERTIRVSLADLPAIHKLREKQIPGWEDSIPLRLVSVSGAAHVDQGVMLQLEVASAVDTLKAGLADLVRAGGRKLKDFRG